MRTISLERCVDDDDFEQDDEEVKRVSMERKGTKESKNKPKKRLYEPDLELSFHDFCILMGFDLLYLIEEESPSFLLEPEQPEKQRKRSNSMTLPSYVPTAKADGKGAQGISQQ